MSEPAFALSVGAPAPKKPSPKKRPAAPVPVVEPSASSAPSASVVEQAPCAPAPAPTRALPGTSGGPRYEVHEREDGTRYAMQLTCGLKAPWVSRAEHAAPFEPVAIELPSRASMERWQADANASYLLGIEARSLPYAPNEYRAKELESEHLEWVKLYADREKQRLEAMNRLDAKLAELGTGAIVHERYAPSDQLGTVSARVAAHEPERRAV